jgi:hypothetical protein
MSVMNRWALLVAVDEYCDTDFGVVPHAEAGAKAVSSALADAGVPKANQIVLLNRFATKGAVESRVRWLKQNMKSGDELLVWLAARGFSFKHRSSLTLWDTLPDDVIECGVSLADLFKEFQQSKASSVVYLMDVGLGVKPKRCLPAAAQPHLDTTAIVAALANSTKATGLLSTTDDEASINAPQLQSSLFAHLVLRSLRGDVPESLNKAGHLSVASLNKFMSAQLPKLIRKHTGEPMTQTPTLLGGHLSEATIADVAGLIQQRTGQGSITEGRLKRMSFRSVSSGRVKDLQGFRKSYKLPESAGPSNRKFIAKCATDDIRDDVDQVLEAVREQFKAKRKDLETIVQHDGHGYLRAEQFEYQVRVELDAIDPTRVNWHREVGQFENLTVLRSPAFEAVFGNIFDELHFEFESPMDMERFIDRIEESQPPGLQLHLTGGGSIVEIKMAGLSGSVTVEAQHLRVRGRTGQMTGLLDQFLHFLMNVGGVDQKLTLPAKG